MVLILVSEVGTDSQDSAAEPGRARLLVDVAIPQRQKTTALIAGELALSGTHAHTAVCPVCHSTLQLRAGPVVEGVFARVNEVRFTFPRRRQKAFLVCFEENSDDSAPDSYGPVAGYLIERSTGTKTPSVVTCQGEELVMWLLRTYCVGPAGRCVFINFTFQTNS